MNLLESLLSQANEWPWSIALRESTWTYPIIEGVHTLTIALFVGFAVMLDLRLIGVFLTRYRVSDVGNRLLPRTRGAFVVMVVSGLLLFSAKPLEFYGNIFFRIKVVLLLLAGLNVWYCHTIAFRGIGVWDADRIPPSNVRVTAAGSIVFWCCIIVCGRLIAYNWFKA
jgi:hypothetical protein